MQWWRAALAALALAAAAGGGAAGAEPRRGPLVPPAELLRKAAGGPLAGLLRRAAARPASHPAPRRPVVPEAMRALYAQLSAPDPRLPAAFLVGRSPLHARTANTVRSFTHEASAIDRRFKEEHRFRLAFNVTIPDGEALTAAEVVLARDSVNFTPGSDAARHRHRVLVYDIVRPGRKGRSPPELRLADARWVRLAQGGDVRLDVTSAVERWLWRPQENHGLLVHVLAPPDLAQHRHVRLRRAAGERRGAWRARQPALLAYTDDGTARLKTPEQPAPHERARRAARRGHRRKDGRESCRRRPLYVDFADVGWSDWIVAPPGYEAFYCHGDCPFPLVDHFNSTNHAIVQMLVNSVNPVAVPKPCCVPTELSSISLLYMDEENKVVLKNYQDMAVVGCGCR